MSGVVDLTLDSDDETHERKGQSGRLVLEIDDDDDYAPVLSIARPPTPPPLIAPPVPMQSARAPTSPPLEIVTQPVLEVVEAQLTPPPVPSTLMARDVSGPRPPLPRAALTEVPSFRAARDNTLQLNDAYNVRRLAAHARALADGEALLAGGVSPSVFAQPIETLLLLERGSPLVTNRRTQYEHGDEFQFSDTFSFVARAEDDELDLGAYQHAFAFTGGRYEVAPPVATLVSAGLFGMGALPRSATRNAAWREYELNSTLAVVGARGSGGLPTMFVEAALANAAVSQSLSDDEFRPLYNTLERRGGTRFSAEVLEQTMDEVRATTSSRATQPHTKALFGGGVDGVESEASGDEEEEEEEATAADRVYDSDGEELPSLTETDERNLEHIRALLAYESVLLERNGVWRSRTSGARDADGVYIVADRLREYRLSAEDECYEFQYDSYVAMDADESETLDRRIRFLRPHEDAARVKLPRPHYEELEVQETQRLGIKSVTQTQHRRRPDVKNVLRAQPDPESERVNGVETPARREARPGASRIAAVAEDEMVEIVDSEGKKRTYEEAAEPVAGEGEEEEEEEEDEDVDVQELGSDQESLASDADLETMQRTLDEEAFGDLNVDETIARDAPARLDERFTATTIAVPLEWDRSTALAAVRAAYQEGDPVDEDTPWWKVDDAVWTAIIELALYEKLVPCFGPAFPEEARETLGIHLELVLRRLNAENQFLEANRSNWRQLTRQRDELIRTIADRLPSDKERQTLARLGDPRNPPLDAQPALLRICVPANSTAFDFLPFIDLDREPLAHIYALAGQRPVGTAVDAYASTELRLEADTCEPEQNYYPFATQYGTREAIERQFNAEFGGDDLRTVQALGALRAYIAAAHPDAAEAAALIEQFTIVDPKTIGTRLYELFERDAAAARRRVEELALRSRRAARQRDESTSVSTVRALIAAVYPTLPTHNRVKPIFLAPPRLARLAALRRAVQGPLFEEAFGTVGRFDAGALARVSALKDAERARRAHEQLENRGAERLFANAAQLYAQEHSSPYGAYVTDQAPRVRTHFRLAPPDLSLPEGVYRVYGDETVVDRESTLRLLKSRVSVGGSRVQMASLEREYVHDGADDGAREPFFLLCAPEVAEEVFTRVATDARTDAELAAVLREALAQLQQHRLASMADYNRFRGELTALFGRLSRICQTRDVPRETSAHYSVPEFVEEAVTALRARAILVLAARTTRPDRLVTLPMSGMAALARADDRARARLRAPLFEIYYRLAVDLRFKRQGYLAVPFNTSTTLPLPTAGDYSNYRTLHLALTRVLNELDANDDEEVDAMLLDASASTDVDERLRRTGALELRTLRNSLEREIEQLHAGRTMWFELSTLCADPQAFARQVVDELIALHNAVTTARVAVVEPFERRETDFGARPPLQLDPRAARVAPHATPLPAVGSTPSEALQDLAQAGEAFEDFEVLIGAVQDAADRDEPLAALLREEAPSAATDGGRSVNRLDLLMGGGGVQQPAKRTQTGAEKLRAQLQRYARLERQALEDARATEAYERTENKIFEQAAQRRQEGATSTARKDTDFAEPHATHKRASIAGINKAAQLAADIGRLTTRQSALMQQFAGQRDVSEALEQMHETLARIVGIERGEEEVPAAQRKLRLVNGVVAVLGQMLDRVGADLVLARLMQRRAALDALRVTSRSTASVETQVAVVQRLLASQAAPATAPVRRVGRRTLSQFDLIAARLLDADVQRALVWLKAQAVLRLLPEREFRVRRGAITQLVRIPALYVALLLPAAVERARLDYQQRIESTNAQDPAKLPFAASESTYAVAHRADAHPSLRIDELVRRYALAGEVPLASRNARYTPYAQFADPTLGGRLADESEQLVAFARQPLSEQHVAFNEGVHRTHAGAADTVLSALMAHLMHLFGTLHGVATLRAVYERSRASAAETEIVSSAVSARLRLEQLLTMFFGGRMPSLEHMRPVDMRLLALAVLGFDASSRTDNDLDNDISTPDDSPVTTPAYAHMRTNTAKRLLADAYHRAVLRRLYHHGDGARRALVLEIDRQGMVERARDATPQEHAVRRGVGAVRGELYRLVVTHEEHEQRYEDNLAFAKLRAEEMDAIGVDRRLLGLTLVEQIQTLGASGAVFNVVERTLLQAAAPRPMPAGFATRPLVDQPWLLLPRVTMVGALLSIGANALLMETLEKILVTLDDSAHLLADDTTDDALALFAEQGRELEALAETPPRVEPGASSAESSTSEQPRARAPHVAVVHRNPIEAAGNFRQWRAGVEAALARILRVERATLGGTFGRTAGVQLLTYEVEATVRPPATVDRFYADLAPALVLAHFIVEEGVDTQNSVEPPALSIDDLQGFFESDEVRDKRRALSDAQFELAKMLVAAEVHRRAIFRPNAEGTALLGGGRASVAEAYRQDENAAFTAAVFAALADAYNGNKKRSAKIVLGEWLAAHKNAQTGTVTGRMVRHVAAFLETTKVIRFSDVERYMPLYDAIQLLFKTSFDTSADGALVRNDQLHPLVDVLAAPLTGRYYLRLRTEPFPEDSLTACRTALIAVYAPRFAWAYSADEARRALPAVDRVVAVHEFAFAVPAAPPPPPASAGEAAAAKKKNVRAGHDFIQVNIVEAAGEVSLRDVLGDSYSPLAIAGNDRYRALLPLIGMPTTANQ